MTTTSFLRWGAIINIVPFLLLLFTTSLFANPIGHLRTIQKSNNGVNITTETNEKIQVEFYSQSTVRIWVGSHQKLIDAKNKLAKIVNIEPPNKVDFSLNELNDQYQLTTNSVVLRIYKQPLKFEAYSADNKTPFWRELKPLNLSSEQSYQTLISDSEERIMGGGQQNGQFEFSGQQLFISYSGGWEEGDRPSPAPFYMSNRNYGVLRNTWSDGEYDFRSEGYSITSHKEHRFDAFYFFGESIHSVLNDFTRLTGRASLLPRWAFEYGDADCYNDDNNIKKPGTYPDDWKDGTTGKTMDVVLSVAKKYREHDMPGGWILPNDGYGCGYTDLPKVVTELKKLGFRTGLWTEDGVDKIAWEVGEAGSRAQKLDVAWTGKGYQFALDANKSAADGILKHSDSRPFLWTVMGWAGIQRYAVTWTGDQAGSWDYIRWHIPTLIGSGLSGQAYATGDVDGIFGGSAETFMRDLQWKSFTPVLMGMSGWSKSSRKHPWWFEEPYRSINRKYLKLKMRLMPYVYTVARETELTGSPIVRGLMWDHPSDPHAFTQDFPYQFFLGKDFLVAPVYESQSSSNGWRKNIYLPKGQWIDYWDGRVFNVDDNGMTLNYPITLDKLPIFIRGGAIIPMYPEALYDGQVAKDRLTLDIYPKGQSEFLLYEDDGNTRQYLSGEYSTQRFNVHEKNLSSIDIQVGAQEGAYSGQEKSREYEMHVHTRNEPEQVSINGVEIPKQPLSAFKDSKATSWAYDKAAKNGTIFIQTKKRSINDGFSVSITLNPSKKEKPLPALTSMPDYGDLISPSAFKVISRPLEENAYPLENAFDNNPDTWFRTSRDQSFFAGPHEFVLYLGERKLISGFDISPRNDKHSTYGHVKDYELYMSDVNGEWGEPKHTGTLPYSEKMQTVSFTPIVGKLIRFRVKSVYYGPETVDANKTSETSSMVSAAKPSSYDQSLPVKTKPLTIGDFALHEQQYTSNFVRKEFLSDWPPHSQNNSHDRITKDKTKKASPNKLSMNDVIFNKGLHVLGNTQIDYALNGQWELFRSDIGIDDSCPESSEMRFQIWGDNQLLYDTGIIKAPTVVKPEIDLRTIKILSLRTIATSEQHCGNWANAKVTGRELAQ